MNDKTYIAIDLKSFYASVECIERQLDPMNTNLVVADESRTEKTICLAVSPSLKAYGISGRARLFEVVQRVREVNAERQRKAPGRTLTGTSSKTAELKQKFSLAFFNNEFLWYSLDSVEQRSMTQFSIIIRTSSRAFRQT